MVLYIAGCGRSGSTLLARLLGEIDGFVPVGELRYVFDRGLVANHLCGCGQPFRSCPFWSGVLLRAWGVEGEAAAALGRRASSVDRLRYLPMLLARWARSPSFRQRLGEHVDVLGRLYRSLAVETGGAVVVDSSKDPSYAYVLANVPGIDLRIVHLVRDSRAVAHSWTRIKVRPEVHQEVAYLRRRRPSHSAMLWDAQNGLCDLLVAAGIPTVRIRYEDLVDDLEAVLATVTAHVGRPRTRRDSARTVHDISGNPLRFSSGPLRVAADFEWHTAAAPAERRLVSALTAPQLWRYGYRIRRT